MAEQGFEDGPLSERDAVAKGYELADDVATRLGEIQADFTKRLAELRDDFKDRLDGLLKDQPPRAQRVIRSVVGDPLGGTNIASAVAEVGISKIAKAPRAPRTPRTTTEKSTRRNPSGNGRRTRNKPVDETQES